MAEYDTWKRNKLTTKTILYFGTLAHYLISSLAHYLIGSLTH